MYATGHLHLPDFWRGLSLGDGGETGERGLVAAAVAVAGLV